VSKIPHCGASVLHCDLPIRYDTYRGGCVFQCSYCTEIIHGRFNPRPFESFKALQSFINGYRNEDTSWLSPETRLTIHWGVLSDPFPPSDFQDRRSYKSLIVFAETGYPVVITTKSPLVIHNEYLSLLSISNALVQVSMTSKSFSEHYEPNAPSYRDRFKMLYTLAHNVKRLVIRSQPFMVEFTDELIRMIPAYKASGVYALLVGGISLRKPIMDISIRTGAGYTCPPDLLRPPLREIRDCCHSNGLVFLTNELECGDLSDSTTCCGCEGLEGFKVNQCNLSYEFEKYVTPSMSMMGSAQCFRSGTRDSRFKERTYLDVLRQFNADGNDGLVK